MYEQISLWVKKKERHTVAESQCSVPKRPPINKLGKDWPWGTVKMLQVSLQYKHMGKCNLFVKYIYYGDINSNEVESLLLRKVV